MRRPVAVRSGAMERSIPVEMLLGAADYHKGDFRTLTDRTAADAAALGLRALNARTDDPYSVTRAEAARFRDSLERHGLAAEQTAGNYGGGLVSEDGAERERTVRFVQEMCRLTQLLGAPTTYLRPGSLNRRGPWLPHPRNRSPAVFDRLVDSARRVCSAAEGEGVLVAVEGGVVSPLYSPARIEAFIAAVDSPALGFNQDPVNLIGSLEQAYDTGALIADSFDRLGRWTVSAHVKDFTLVEALLPHFEEAEIGAGMLDQAAYLTRLQAVRPSVHAYIEHLATERFAAAVTAVTAISRSAGVD